ncbi:hypothetical protein ABPG77_007545 [Micractinium sp. CCAP 211/92]
METIPLDEEGFGKGAAPEASGIPRDPANARSKQWALRALIAMGFGLAIDFSMSLMSIQPLYYVMNGPSNLYGLVFGAYDLMALIFAPLFGFWCDRSRRFKHQMQLGSAVNAAGNLLYAFTVLADKWWLMLLGRGIAGAGEATLGVGSSYITQTTTHERRQARLHIVLGRYRISQNIARMVGPFVGYLFLGLPDVHNGSSTALKMFNWYTLPGWFAFFMVLALMAFFAWGFTDPTEENEHLVKPESRGEGYGPPSPERIRRFRTFAASWLLLSFLSIFAVGAFTANLFALFAGQYHQITSQTDNWKTYIGVAGGAFTAGFVFRRMIRWAPQYWEERKLSLLTNWLLFITWMLVIPYGGATWVPPPALYYVATALAGFVVVINQTSIETVFSKKLTQYADVVGDSVGKHMGAYFMAASGGRFAGPLVAAAIAYIATPSGDTNVCTDWVENADGSWSCAGQPPSAQCAITGDAYYVEGCVLYRAIPMTITLAVLQFCTNIGFWFVLHRHWSYENDDLAPKAGQPGAPTAATIQLAGAPVTAHPDS